MPEAVLSTPAPAESSSPSAADSSATVGASAQGTTGGSPDQGGSPVSPDSGSSDRILTLPNPDTDPEGYEKMLWDMSDEDQALFGQGKFEYKKDEAELADKPEENAPQEKLQGQEHDDVPLTPAQFAKLPAYVQRKLEQAQAMQDVHSEYAEFLRPEFQKELDEVLADPRVQAVVQERKRGGQFSFNPNQVLTKDTLATLAAKAGVDIRTLDHSLDPEGTEAAILKIIGHGIEEGKSVGRIESAMQAKAEAAQKARVDFYDNGLKGLMDKVPAMKSDLPFHDPKHPTVGFQNFIRSGIEQGQFTHEMVMEHGIEPMFMLYQTKNGGIQQILNRPMVNAKARFLESAQAAANKEAVSLVGSKVASKQGDSMTQHGIDGEKFINDPKYQAQVLDRMEDPAILEKLGNLLNYGKWS